MSTREDGRCKVHKITYDRPFPADLRLVLVTSTCPSSIGLLNLMIPLPVRRLFRVGPISDDLGDPASQAQRVEKLTREPELDMDRYFVSFRWRL
jgi:hypothetical protein